MNYTLKLEPHELHTLAVVGRSYESAGILHDGLIETATAGVFEVSEPTAWDYRDAIPADWGYEDPDNCPATVPPLVGGMLAVKLHCFYEEIT